MKVDYLIVGQGIAGSVLTLELMRTGKTVMVLNHETENTSSNKAGGLYNPITGRQMVKTWLADQTFPVLESYYQQLEVELKGHFIYPMPIYRPFLGHEEQNDWSGRSDEESYKPYIRKLYAKSRGIPYIDDQFGGLELNYSGFVDLPVFIDLVRNQFITKGVYQTELFDYDQLHMDMTGVTYKHIHASQIIFCEGPEAVKNPFWGRLPFKLVKGEIMDITGELPDNMIINRGVFIIPKNGRHRVGSTYDHSTLDYVPSKKGIKNLSDRLSKLYNGQMIVANESAGVRPATFDRRPFIGHHPKFKQVSIFNGFGTKGVSMVPYFASQFVNYLTRGGELMSEVDVARVIV